MKRLAILGAGDLGLQIQHQAALSNTHCVVSFFDDTKPKGSKVNGLIVAGGIEDIELSFQKGDFDCIIIAIGYRHMSLRGALFSRWKNRIPFATIIHPHSYIDPTARIGEGVVIYPGCVVDMNVVIEGNVLLNTGCIISHDTLIGENCFLSPCVKLAGFVTISPNVVLGINTTIIDNIKISEGVRTAGGAVVIDPISQPGLYAGVPAVFKKDL